MLATHDNSNVTPVVAVTGGSEGLGKAIVAAFANQGATVIMLARNEARLNAAAEELNATEQRVIPAVADVTNDQSVQHAIERIAQDFGRLDVWVNNVGKSSRACVTDCSIELYNELMQLNFYTAVRCTNLALPLLQKTSGSLINIGSLASKTAWPWMAPYTSSKHALAAYSHQLRLEGPANVNFLHVMPGPIKRDDAGSRYDDQAAGVSENARKPGAGAKVKGIAPKILAEKIVWAQQRRKAELVVPAKSRILFALSQLSPTAGDWLLKKFASKDE